MDIVSHPEPGVEVFIHIMVDDLPSARLFRLQGDCILQWRPQESIKEAIETKNN